MVLEHVNLKIFRVCEIKFSKFKLLVLICVKVERKYFNSERVTSTLGFVNKLVKLSSKMAHFAKYVVPLLARVGAWCLQYVMCVKSC